ncbi:biopolymer transporter ExbB [uncultured Albimonas sp.]|uniref:biopolymer transporter ExbB n=1 Tax=uncultured Albimonas sp. TaxID=1331701 RepID=UPI0030ECD772|tara:strand:+ start:5693 stop:6895 length:1203 start_codon:yes stop_codon:yes gene_type:complete
MAIVQDRKIEFSQPVRQIVLMIVVLALVAVGIFFLLGPIEAVFSANVWLNGFIAAVFVIGVLTCFWQALSLVRAVNWLEGFAIDRPGHEFVNPPRLLTSLASLLRDRRAREALTATSSRSLLDTVATRLDEQRDITRYIINMLILVGLLGTFWGLSQVVPGIVETMRSLSGTQDANTDSMQVFSNLMAGLNSQLDGMGTAFASSLLGLAGSLVVGLLDLFAGHGQNRFYRELEEWLSSISRISLGGGEGDGSAAGFAAEALERNAEQIESLVVALRDAEDRQRAADARLETLANGLSGLVRALEEERETRAPAPEAAVAFDDSNLTGRLDRLAAAQERVVHLLEKAQEKEETDEGRQRLRSIDLQITRLLEEVSAGRQEATAELRMDLARLTRAVSGERG